MGQSERLRQLEDSYLSRDDPYKQCGWLGTPEKWRAHREISLDAVHHDGSILDVGCANGFLMECLVTWGRQRGIELEPYGVEIGSRLVELARRRLPEWSSRIYHGDIRDWSPPRRFDFVHANPPDRSPEHVTRLLSDFVEPGGRLILRSYFNPSPADPWNGYFDNEELLRSMGLQPAGKVTSDPPGAEFVWVDRPKF